jgi:hypothetical protein
METTHKSFGLRWAMAAVLVLVSSGVLLAADRHEREYWRGKPAFAPGESSGYFIWNDDEGWHVRWTIRKGVHVFTGSVSCDGAFNKFQPFRKEGKDYIKKVSESSIRFDTKTGEGVDGVDFTLSPSTRRITFDLRMDGATAPPDAVKIGRGKRNPPHIPFTIDRGAR